MLSVDILAGASCYVGIMALAGWVFCVARIRVLRWRRNLHYRPSFLPSACTTYCKTIASRQSRRTDATSRVRRSIHLPGPSWPREAKCWSMIDAAAPKFSLRNTLLRSCAQPSGEPITFCSPVLLAKRMMIKVAKRMRHAA